MAAAQPVSRHFTLQKVGDGVHAAIANDGAWAICNAGIIDLGDSVVVFDTFVNQQAASDLKAAAEQLTGKRAGVVVNSHYHSDHVKGNQVFAGAHIVSTSKTREVMTVAKQRYDTERETIRKSVQEDLDSWLSKPDDPDSFLYQGYDMGHLQGLPTLDYTLPDVAFDSSMTLHGSKRKAEVVTYGGGHTVSDAILYLPDERIAFMGDLLFVECHPYVADGDVGELFRILEKVKSLDMKTLVPGHGPVGSPEDITRLIDHIEELQRTASEAKSAGKGAAEAAETPMSPRFASWKWRSFRKENLEFLIQGTRP